MQATLPTVNPTPADCWTDGHWLEHSEDFSVESSAGRLGYVATVDSANHELIVLGNHGVTRVPFAEIDFIDPPEERIVLRGGFATSSA
jgi:hypothetical protein